MPFSIDGPVINPAATSAGSRVARELGPEGIVGPAFGRILSMAPGYSSGSAPATAASKAQIRARLWRRSVRVKSAWCATEHRASRTDTLRLSTRRSSLDTRQLNFTLSQRPNFLRLLQRSEGYRVQPEPISVQVDPSATDRFTVAATDLGKRSACFPRAVARPRCVIAARMQRPGERS